MDRIVAIIVMFILAAAAATGGLLWVRSQRELHRRRDQRELIRRRAQLRRAVGWVVVGLVFAGGLAILAGALLR